MWYLVTFWKWGFREKGKQKVIHVFWPKWPNGIITIRCRDCKRRNGLMEKEMFSVSHALKWLVLMLSQLKIMYLVSLNGNRNLKFILLAPENHHLCLNARVYKWQLGHFEFWYNLWLSSFIYIGLDPAYLPTAIYWVFQKWADTSPGQ